MAHSDPINRPMTPEAWAEHVARDGHDLDAAIDGCRNNARWAEAHGYRALAAELDAMARAAIRKRDEDR